MLPIEPAAKYEALHAGLAEPPLLDPVGSRHRPLASRDALTRDERRAVRQSLAAGFAAVIILALVAAISAVLTAGPASLLAALG